jgi:hypothetical protein
MAAAAAAAAAAAVFIQEHTIQWLLILMADTENAA